MNSFTAPTFTRRAFLRTSALAAVASRVAVARVPAAAAGMSRHLPARVVSAPDIPLPAGKREPFGWKTAAIGAAPLVLAASLPRSPSARSKAGSDASAKSAAAKTLAGLQPRLTCDGFLGGIRQANKGGEGLQRGNYRVIYQMGMGLLAKHIAALETKA